MNFEKSIIFAYLSFRIDMANQKRLKSEWLSMSLIATLTRFLCRELTFQIRYLRVKNQILKSRIKKRIIFTENERRILDDYN